MIFVYLYDEIRLPFREKKKYRWLSPVLGGGAVTIIGLIFGKEIMGTGGGLVLSAFNDQNFIAAGIILLAGKLLSTTVTVKSGGSGGITFPAIIMGALSANIISRLLGLEDIVVNIQFC